MATSSSRCLSPSPLVKGRILVVDDSRGARERVCSTLRDAGYQTSEACEGSEGLWRARTQEFDAVLTDIHMPTMDGLEFIRQLRQLRGYDKTPVFVLTSDVTRACLAEGRQAGATAWLVKPPAPAALLRAVRDALAPE